MTSTRRVEFNTTDYQFSHGRAPRGVGTWAFFRDRSSDPCEGFWVNQASFTEAKKAAAVWARQNNVATVYVGS